LLNPSIDRDLEAICLKCLEKNPRSRYARATQLAEDLGRYLEGESITIRSVNLVERMARALERSQHDVDFHAWSAVLLWFAAIILAAEISIYFHALEGPSYPHWWATLTRAVQFAAFGAVLWGYRWQWLGSIGSVHRQMWSVWTAYLLSSFLVLAPAWMLTPRVRRWTPSSSIRRSPSWRS
jgi:serine/threonine-protein kinase